MFRQPTVLIKAIKLIQITMKKYITLFSLLLLSSALMAQKGDTSKLKKNDPADSLLNAISTDNKPQNVVIFKATRLILSQSTELTKKKNLNFLIIHRFGDFAGSQGGGQ